MTTRVRVLLCAMLIGIIAMHATDPAPAFGQSETAQADAAPGTGAAAPVEASDTGPSLVTIDWFDEMKKGGNTMIVLAILSVLGLAVVIERLFALRRSCFAPDRLQAAITEFERTGDQAALREACGNDKTILAQTVSFALNHQHHPFDQVSVAVGDLAARSIRGQMSHTQMLAAVAGLAPLLGLLGTMIGMIESFKLVSIYGDDGGAAILADSIAKALITTAVGLIIAIPALATYHYFKHRVNAIAAALELSVEAVITALFFKPVPVDTQTEAGA